MARLGLTEATIRTLAKSSKTFAADLKSLQTDFARFLKPAKAPDKMLGKVFGKTPDKTLGKTIGMPTLWMAAAIIDGAGFGVMACFS
jgi:hypothetical protein